MGQISLTKGRTKGTKTKVYCTLSLYLPTADTKRSGSKKPSSTSRHLASEDADSDSKSENKKGKSSHGSKKSKKDVREGRDEKRENKDKKSSSRMASASPTSQEEITNNYPKFTETSPDMSSDSNEAEEGGSSGPRRRPKRYAVLTLTSNLVLDQIGWPTLLANFTVHCLTP